MRAILCLHSFRLIGVNYAFLSNLYALLNFDGGPDSGCADHPAASVWHNQLDALRASQHDRAVGPGLDQLYAARGIKAQRAGTLNLRLFGWRGRDVRIRPLHPFLRILQRQKTSVAQVELLGVRVTSSSRRKPLRPGCWMMVSSSHLLSPCPR